MTNQVKVYFYVFIWIFNRYVKEGLHESRKQINVVREILDDLVPVSPGPAP